jgi:hypothetical protein
MQPFPVDGYDMAYLDVGGGPPLKCVHGSLCDFQSCYCVLGPLGKLRHRCFLAYCGRGRQPKNAEVAQGSGLACLTIFRFGISWNPEFRILTGQIMTALDPLPNLIGQVYERIPDGITDRMLPYGQRIRQNALSEQLGASWQPVPHTLHLLHREGVVTELIAPDVDFHRAIYRLADIPAIEEMRRGTNDGRPAETRGWTNVRRFRV